MSIRSLPKPHELLQKALDRQVRRNPSYSLRALARSLQISPSFLSGVFRGKKPIPEKRVDELARALAMDEAAQGLLKEAIVFGSLTKNQTTLDALGELWSKKSIRSARLARYHEGTIGEFSALSPWYRLALADLVTCIDFNPDPLWIAGRLGITPAQAEGAMQALRTEGIIKERNGKFLKVASRIRFPTVRSHPAIREYHKSMIEKALRILLGETSDEAFQARLISSVGFAANPKNLPKARRRLQEALYEVAEILAQGECTQVYQLNAQMFPLTR